MNTAQILKFITTASFTVLSFFLSTSFISASEVIFTENFESELNIIGAFPANWTIARNRQWSNSSLKCKNDELDAEWKIFDISGNKVVGITIQGPSCVTEIIPNNFQIPDSSNYMYESEIIFPTNINDPRNVAFRYKTGVGFYGLKFLLPNFVEMQKVNVIGYNSHFQNFNYLPGFSINNRHKIKIISENDLIQVYINNQLQKQIQDQEPILKDSTFALQASNSNASVINSVYFDNITITDLSPQPTPTPTPLPSPTPTPTLTPTPMPTPTPTPLPTPSFPHFSQLDPQWKDLEYDNAYTNNNGYPSTMGQLSCAVTSASMLITKQGYPIGPDGQSTNPYSLNQYLTENNHYTKYSGVVWSGITKYVKDTKDNGLVSSQTPLLEFKYPTYSPSLVQNLLSQQIPSLLKTKNSSSNYSNHFVVLSDYNQSLDDFEIHDPLTLAFNNETLKSSYPASQYVQTGYFSPSFTNLGYIWLYLHHQDVSGYIEYQSQKTGIQPNGDEITQIPQSINTHEERTFSPFVDPQTIPDNQKTISRVIAIPKPASGNYTIVIDSLSSIQPKDIEVFAYDTDANHQIFEPITTSSSKFPQIFTLNYNADDISKTSLHANNHQASLEYLKNTIIHLRSQNHISDNKASQKLIEFVENAIKHQNKSHIIVNLLSHPFKNQVQLYARKGDIDPTAYQEILLITNAVINSLTP